MRMVISCVASYEDAFRKALGAKRNAEAKKELTAKKRTLQKSENRLAELDRLFKRIYEDMVNGKLSESRFQMLSEDYEKEQADLRIKIEMLEEEIQNQEDQADNVDKFIRQAKKYLHLEKLTPTILNDMVNAVYGLNILVHDLRLLTAVGVEEVAARVGFIIRTVDVAVAQGHLQVGGNLAAPLGDGFLLGDLNGGLDAVNGLGVALGDDCGHAVLGFGAIHRVGLPAVQEGEPTGDQNLLLILKFLHFHLPP